MSFSNPYVINKEFTEQEYKQTLGGIINGTAKQFVLDIAYKHAKWVYTRTRACESQNWRCCYCGIKFGDESGKADTATAEHVIPKSKGGSDEYENIVAACHKCNSTRGNTPLEEFLDILNSPKLGKAKKKAKRAIALLKRGYFLEHNDTVFSWAKRLAGKDDQFYKNVINEFYKHLNTG